ncbi:MAG: hypothetical protein J6C26_09050 [Clostridia bacterium]|nr:hypothetical protein [Clostridia bacterium]
MAQFRKKQAKNEICIHYGRNTCIILSLPIILLLVFFVLILVIGKSELYWILPILILFMWPLVWMIYNTWGETMTVNDDGIHWRLPMHKNLSMSVPWEDVIEIYREFSLRPAPTFILFRNGPEIYREKDTTNDVYKTTLYIENEVEMEAILAEHGLSIQQRAPKWMS